MKYIKKFNEDFDWKKLNPFSKKSKGVNPVPEQHTHKWELQYRTGNPMQGKTEVCKCQCGQWAIRPFGEKEYKLLEKK